MIYLSFICGTLVFLQCVCQLAIFRWRITELELWAHVCLIAGAVSVMLHRDIPHQEDFIFHVGVAIYFTAHTWRVWRAKCRHCRDVKSFLKLLKAKKGKEKNESVF